MLLRPFLRILAAAVVVGAFSAAPAFADVDTTPPEIAVTVPAEGQVFASDQGGVPTGFTCTDEPGGSGVATCAGDATLDTARVGDRVFTVQTTVDAGEGGQGVSTTGVDVTAVAGTALK